MLGIKLLTEMRSPPPRDSHLIIVDEGSQPCFRHADHIKVGCVN